jgi:DHA1 family inner membrane transport protein
MPIQLYAFALGAFAIGTTEFVIMGLLPQVAADLAISIPVAGLLVTGYALGVLVAAPIMTLGTTKVDRKTLLVSLMSLFFIGNLMAALAPNYAVLLAGRIVSSSMHGAFFGVGSVVAAGLVAKEKQSRAIALMFSGLALSNIIGVPLGTALGQAMGWRATFFVVSLLGLAAGSFLFAVLKPQAADSSGSIANEISALARPRVWLALGTTTFGFGGVFVVWTYIAPILGSATGLSPEWITGVLFVFGIGLTLGNHFVGQWADKSLSLALVGVLAALILLLALFSVTMNAFVPATITIFFLGVAAFGTIPPLQMGIMEAAKGAPNLASALNIGAFNLGNAGGAWVGGLLIGAGYPSPALALAAAGVSSIGLVLAIVSRSSLIR